MSISPCTLVGRSSSHFTRVARVFAAELQVSYRFEIVSDLGSRDSGHYADNPALKVPILRAASGTWFGTLPICRELLRQSARRATVVWPEDLARPVSSNMQELVLQAMTTEVALIMRLIGDPSAASDPKLTASLVNSVEWLERHVSDALAELPPERDLSFLETTLFCLLEHLEFRRLLPTEPHAELRRFRDRFAQRESAQATPFRFD